MLKTVKIQKEDEPKKKKRTSRVNARSSKNINQINQEEIKTEKDYTQGQEHIPEHEISEKPENISSTNIQENEQTSNEETSGKKVIKLKPRETHLKDKMNKMQFDESLLSGINKGIEGQLKSLKEDIIIFIYSSLNIFLSDLKISFFSFFDKGWDCVKIISFLNI